jgi:glycosyltransferase involved in cell wall biosynthesis
MKKIEWLCPIPNCRIQDLEQSNLASIRLRTAVSANAAKEHGYKIDFSDGHKPTNSYLVIVGKIDGISDTKRPMRWMQHLRKAKQNGVRILIDYTDHHLAVDSAASRFYAEALPLADTVVCSSKMLATHLNEFVNCQKIIIEDPIEVSVRAPRVRQNEQLTALWFGHSSNLPYLIEYLRNVLRLESKLRLIIMTNAYPLNQEYVQRLTCPELDFLDVNVVPWSQENLVEAASLSDFCLLPAGIDDPRKNGASSNRLLTAMALGLPVAADLLSSYMPFKSYFADIRSDEIVDIIKDPSQYFDCVEEVQKYIQDKFTKKAISNEWIDLIDKQIKEASSVKTVTNETCTLQILILTYNQENLCHRIITNVESYVSSNINVLIQDDCSQDGTYRELSKYFDSHPYVKVFKNTSNLGAIKNYASLTSKATSEYVVCLGGDDFVVPEELLKAMALLAVSPVDVAVFNCAHAELGVIDQLILGAPRTSDKHNILIRNNQFTEATNLNQDAFYNQIATMPGALWNQGVIFRSSVLKKIPKMEARGVDEWGVFHNLAVYAQKHSLRIMFFKHIISLLGVMPNSRGSQVENQLNRQLSAVMNDWHSLYRKTALINILEKKLKQFQNSSMEANEIFDVLKSSFTKI